MKKLLIISTALLLTACAANPNVITEVNGNENQMSCRELALEKQHATQAWEQANAEDRFHPKYMLPGTGMLSAWNINKARSAAERRIQLLDNYIQQKNCSQAEMTVSDPMQLPYPSIPDEPIDPSMPYQPQIPESEENILPPALP